MAKENCWEHKKCGREMGGAKVNELGYCVSALFSLPGKNFNGGKNGGRICWALAGTLCGGMKQGTFAEKYNNCKKCDFFQLVKNEEGEKFTMLLAGLKMPEVSKE